MKTVRAVSLKTADEPMVSPAYVMNMPHGIFKEKRGSILDKIK